MDPCDRHSDLAAQIGIIANKVDQLEDRIAVVDGKVDLVLQALIPRPLDQTLPGRLAALAAPIVADQVARRLLAGAALVVALACGGAAGADLLARYLGSELLPTATGATGGALDDDGADLGDSDATESSYPHEGRRQ